MFQNVYFLAVGLFYDPRDCYWKRQDPSVKKPDSVLDERRAAYNLVVNLALSTRLQITATVLVTMAKSRRSSSALICYDQKFLFALNRVCRDRHMTCGAVIAESIIVRQNRRLIAVFFVNRFNVMSDV